MTTKRSDAPPRKITAQGLRAYFVTSRRGEFMPDEQIAALIGQTSQGRTIKSVYGGTPESWITSRRKKRQPKSIPPWADLFTKKKARRKK